MSHICESHAESHAEKSHAESHIWKVTCRVTSHAESHAESLMHISHICESHAELESYASHMLLCRVTCTVTVQVYNWDEPGKLKPHAREMVPVNSRHGLLNQMHVLQ